MLAAPSKPCHVTIVHRHPPSKLYSEEEMVDNICSSSSDEDIKSTNHNTEIEYKHDDENLQSEEFEETPLYAAILTYLSYAILCLFGWLRDFLRDSHIEKKRGALDPNATLGFVPLYQSYESFYTRNMYTRVRDIFNRPIASVPGAQFELTERISDDYNWTYRYTGKTINAINLGSYNYLGFAEKSGPCATDAINAIKTFGVGNCNSRIELGTQRYHVELERLVADFLHVESSIAFGMGFATNALNLPALASKGDLILSDEMNHVSLILGMRLSGATYQTFAHNDMKDLEKKLRAAIVHGHPRTNRPWKKIIIVVEGVYSELNKLILALVGKRRICQLADNTRYFRQKLVDMGFIVFGNKNSPVVPMLIYMPARVTRFNREMLRRGVAVVTVGFPATKLLDARVRFCISAAHTRQMLDTALMAIDEVGTDISLRYSTRHKSRRLREL
ncbi:unnamed protein product [Adineta steineri]|uniref:Aminotransferase class I/classII large domain-containing protein n=1 Tax=Adineta steineri TaxID=433720 RepID=A0A818R286_9BILA|nr:unnamed protein product [Adineta steineri]